MGRKYNLLNLFVAARPNVVLARGTTQLSHLKAGTTVGVARPSATTAHFAPPTEDRSSLRNRCHTNFLQLFPLE